MTMLLGAGAIGIAAFFAGQQMAGHARDSRLGHNFERLGYAMLETSTRSEANVWKELGYCRTSKSETIGITLKIDEIQGKARDEMLQRLAAEKAQADQAAALAEDRFQKLKDAADDMARNWKAGSVPHSITCGVYDARDCPDPYPPARTAVEGGVEVRGAATGKDDAS